MPKYICSGCSANFYADKEIDDFEVGEQFFCSYCYPKVRLCGICGKLKIFKYIVKNDNIGICPECRSKEKKFPNVWLMLRFKTFSKDNFTCRYCGRSPLKDKNITLNCDHIIPKSKNGQDELDNLITACCECNLGKTDVLLNQHHIDLLKSRITETDP